MPIQLIPILPDDFNASKLFLAILHGMEDSINVMLALFQETIQTWDDKPDFLQSIQIRPGVIIGRVQTWDEVYTYVSQGTEARVIEAQPGKVLAFPRTFTSKTVPGVLRSRAGSKSDDMIFTKRVNHKGIKARKFDKTVLKAFKPFFVIRMTAAILKGAHDSGHYIQK